MKAKDFLLQLNYENQKIRSKQAKLESIENSLGLKAVSYDFNGGSSGSYINKTEELIIKKVELENEIEADLKYYEALLNNVYEVINQIDDFKVRFVLILRYVHDVYWSDIAKTLKISLRHTHRLHKKGLQKIDKIIHKTM